ncbi:MAG: DUF1648 domain-containing protein [Thaumarchaeota archaeon]|nr:DUF1648 domain-containing protein [Candidatus Calditenuaceae archaeon]MDW8186589.1 DUF1648 domain-containing protein [Nitrososphaerota archaeon]
MVAAYALLSYGSLPEIVAIDFDFAGRPTQYAPKTELLTVLLLLIAIMSSITVLISVISINRHTVVERYPYLINLPALALLMGRLPSERRRFYVDRVFMPLPALALFLNVAFFLSLTHLIIESAKTEIFPAIHVLSLVIVPTFSIILLMILYYRKIYHELRLLVT